MKIHMDTERVYGLKEKISAFSGFLYDSTEGIKSQINQIAWTGASAEDFVQRNLATCNRIHLLAEEVARKYLDLEFEIEQWVDVDKQGVNRLKGVEEVSKSPEFTDEMWDEYNADKRENRLYRIIHFKFNQWWKDQTLAEKKQYLQDLQERMAELYGMPKVLLGFDDLPENGGDSVGISIGGAILLDVDNVNSMDPWRLIEFTFHETRHEYQQQVVNNFQNSGQLPVDVTQNQVEAWAAEFKNYIKPDDNFRDYYNQAVERDARDFGDEVMKDVLTGLLPDFWPKVTKVY